MDINKAHDAIAGKITLLSLLQEELGHPGTSNARKRVISRQCEKIRREIIALNLHVRSGDGEA